MNTRRDFMKQAAAGSMAGIIASGTAPAVAKAANRKKRDVSIEEAQKLHDKMLIIDGHNDTPVKRISIGENPLEWMKVDMQHHTDIPRMHKGGYDAGFMIVGNGVTANVWVTTECVLRDVEKYPDDLMLCLNSKDVLEAQKKGKLGIIIAVEGIGRWLDGNPDTLNLMYRLGLRLSGVTHGEGGSEAHFMQGTRSVYRICTMQERDNDRKNGVGLTSFGKEVLKRSNELGIVVDTSHINDRAFYDVMELSAKPTIMSHTAVYELCNHARCMTDDQLKALAETGGVMGVAFAPQFIDVDREKATLGRFVEHLCYVADLVGVDHVAIGTDFDGLGADTIPIIPEVSQLAKLTRSMMAHGLSNKEIAKIWGGNFHRVLKQTIDG